MFSTLTLVSVSLLSLLHTTCGTALYGTTLVPSSSACEGAKSGCTQLVRIDTATGTLTNIGSGHVFLDGLNDLGVIVGDLYYALGAGWKGGSSGTSTGPTLVALSLKDGSEVCRASVSEFHVVQSIGGGQSLLHDAKNHRLLLAGFNASSTRSPHVLLSAPLAGGCGPFTTLGAYGEGGPAPFAMQHHGSSLDTAGQRLFATMITPTGEEGVGVVDVSGLAANLTALYPIDGHHQVLYGPTFLASSGLLVGAFDHALDSPKPGQGVDWNTLDPATGTWTNAPLKYAPGVPTFDGLLGAGVLRAFDAASSTLYVAAWRGEEAKANTELVAIDARSGTMTAHSGPFNGDLGWAYTILQNMALASL
jgi:hypothetical protein